MTDETARMLEEALDDEVAAQANADEFKRACLAYVAEELPGRLDAFAKTVAQGQPDVTRSLGAEGVRQLRSELETEATSLAGELKDSVGQISWPSSRSRYSQVDNDSIRTALFEYLSGVRVGKIAAIFKYHGYDIQDDNAQSGQGLVDPLSLYDESQFGLLARALKDLDSAKRHVASARTAHDNATVDDLWGD